MKFFRYTVLCMIFSAGILSCNKKNKDRWNVEIKNAITEVQITDISKEFYDANIPLETFKHKYPWFQGTVSDADFAQRKSDASEAAIYREAISKIDQKKLQRELADLFTHVKHYFPTFNAPKTFIYSSALQGIMEPVFYLPEKKMLFIDISGFMGENDKNYNGLDLYLKKTMTPGHIIPKVSGVLAENFVPVSPDHQKFIDQIIYNGKIMMLQDAFIPNQADYLKIGYTPKQNDWAKANEANIWNYFVENDLIFSDDPRLKERFINPGPFSKFYTEIDNQSSPQIGIFSGWMICRKLLEEKPDMKLQDFLKMPASEIFNQSNYKPKN